MGGNRVNKETEKLAEISEDFLIKFGFDDKEYVPYLSLIHI